MSRTFRCVLQSLCHCAQDIEMCPAFSVPLLTGCSEMLMAEAVSQLAAKTPGKEAIAMEAFARSLRMVGYVPSC